MTEGYIPYPALDAAPQDNHSPHMSDDSQSGPPPQIDTTGSKSRRHAACDECRKRKLKCSGEPTGCSRCVKNAIPCIYSQQKQMGRPRKKQKTDETYPQEQNPLEVSTMPYMYPDPMPVQPLPHPQPTQTDATPIDPSLSNVDHEMASFQNVCSGPIAQTIRNQRETESFRDSVNMFGQEGAVIDHGSRLTQYPTDISQWPDFSTIETLPLPLTTKYSADPALDPVFSTPSSMQEFSTPTDHPYYDADADPATLKNLPATPSCPCLPNLYLSLSTLSTLTSFPVSQHTIDTLLSAHKTAHSVIYCSVCPQQYQSGAQNLMLGCTLLNVLADQWHRVRRTSVDDLKKGFGRSEQRDKVNGNSAVNNGFISTREGQTWRQFVKQIVRAYVFGDAAIPKPPPSSPSMASTPTSLPSSTILADDNHHQESPRVPGHLVLTYLISALERRQRQWHRLDAPTDEFPDRWAAEYPTHSRHAHDRAKGRPKTIVEVAGKIHDPDDPIPRRSNGSIDVESRDRNGSSNGTASEGGGEGGNDNHGHGDTLLCLLIVKHSKDIVNALDEEQ